MFLFKRFIQGLTLGMIIMSSVSILGMSDISLSEANTVNASSALTTTEKQALTTMTHTVAYVYNLGGN